MTDREEALTILQNCLDYENGEKCVYPIFPIERYEKALKTAIEALKDRPHGEWICKDTINGQALGFSCSNCKMPEYKISLFCPNCGALMRKGGDNK